MSNRIARASRALHNSPHGAAPSRLTDRLAAMAPPLDLTTAQMAKVPRQSAAVAAALSTSAAIIKRADERARRSRSIIWVMVHGFVSACAAIPYALLALLLRLLMARVFFLDGQPRIDGPRLPINVHGFDFSIVLPAQVKTETFGLFITRYAAVPVPTELGAYLLSYAEFILPICLVLGFATRFAVLGMLIITALLQFYVMPDAIWNAPIYWAAILLVLLSRGPGQLSADHVIKLWARA